MIDFSGKFGIMWMVPSYVSSYVTRPNHSDASEHSWAEPVTSANHQSEVPQEALGDPDTVGFKILFLICC